MLHTYIGDSRLMYMWLNADIRSASVPRHWSDETRRVFEINPSVRVNHTSSFFFSRNAVNIPGIFRATVTPDDRFRWIFRLLLTRIVIARKILLSIRRIAFPWSCMNDESPDKRGWTQSIRSPAILIESAWSDRNSLCAVREDWNYVKRVKIVFNLSGTRWKKSTWRKGISYLIVYFIISILI